MTRRRRERNDLSIAELELMLARKKLEARQARVDEFKRTGRILPGMTGLESTLPAKPSRLVDERLSASGTDAKNTKASPFSRTVNRLLFAVEIIGVIGLLYVLLSGAGALQTLNREVAEALAISAPMPTPLITAVVLPSGHTPPTAPGGARPNESEIPDHLRPLVQSMPVVSVPTPGPAQARSIFIPSLWNDAAPIVQGDGWEQLKKGVGQFIGSANPGQRGNIVLSAHNDIFGELFRDLDQLKAGDEILIQTVSQEFVYRVTGTRIVEPTEVSVLEPTAKPTITLISCYPYLVDNLRIVVFAELVSG
ncbi:MAG: class D sortase [Anaerolineales bacterium]|nr:MAG: class D sortase [Anaerolineales bacterium]